MKARRLLVLSDLHCGARTGLTPPKWQSPSLAECGKSKWAEVQGACWGWYAREIESLGAVDVLVVNGDAIDGRNERSGGTELITGDRKEQCEIAAECLSHVQMAKGGKIYIVRGTPYHTGREEDWEDILADMVSAVEVRNHPNYVIRGTRFDFKHKVGSSTIPHGRHTATAREYLWAERWAKRSNNESPDVLIRSHVHYFQFVGDADFLGMSTPGLQAFGSKYGARQCSGTVDFGFVSFDITGPRDYTWRPHLAKIEVMMPSETVVF